MEATQQPPAPAGERGSHPLRRAQFALGKLFDRWWRRSAKLLEPGVVMAQKQAGTTSFVIWVGAVVEGLLAEEVHAQLVVTPADGAAGGPGTPTPIETPIELVWYCIDSEREESGQADGIRFFHGHATVRGLEPGTVYAVRLADGPLGPTPGPSGRPVQIRARTLPKPLATGDRLRVFAASCYDGDTDSGNRLDRAFTAVFGQDVPDLTLLLGDQVYADAPAWRYALLSRHTPRTGLLMKYWRSWGMQTRKGRSRPGLSGVLGSGPTYFLPDDHEFWNNWPNRTVTAKHSIGKIRTAIRNGRERELALAPETDEPMVRPPHDPRFPPTNPYQQNYLPVHPAEWDAWALASFELFGSFQTKAYGPPSRGEMDPRPTRDSPPEPGTENRIHEPRHPVVQVVEVDPVTIALLDTRTRRTRRARHPYHSGFADREFVEEVLDAAERAPVFVLALSQPLLLPASWLRDRDRRERFSLFGDIGMQDYWYQYQWFWTELVRRRDRRPTITVGGDIHRSYLALARSPELNLLEVVASPMSLVTGGRLLELPAKLAGLVGAGSGLDYEASDQGFLPLWKVTAGPRGLPFVDGEARSLGSLPQNRPGFAGLVVEKLDGDAVRLDVRLFDRDRVVGAVDGGEPIDATIVKRFRLDYGVERRITEEGAAGPGLPAAR